MEKIIIDTKDIYIKCGYNPAVAEQMARDELVQHLDSLPAKLGNVLWKIYEETL
jgi:hypothetical protein